MDDSKWETENMRLRTTKEFMAADPGRLAESLGRLIELGPRDYAHVDNLDRVAAYVSARFQVCAADVTEQAWTVQGMTYRNVYARFGPATGARIVVGAHYDTAGPFPGADDNASGVAGLLELAHLLRGQAPRLTVELAAYSLEEPPFFGSGHMGSAVHAASLVAAGAPVKAMLALEMIGYFTDAPGSQNYPLPGLHALYPDQGNFIAVAGRLQDILLVNRIHRAMKRGSPLDVQAIAAPASMPGIALSDNASFWDADFKAVMITDTAFFRNPHYHAVNDSADTLDFARMACVVDGVFRAVLALAR